MSGKYHVREIGEGRRRSFSCRIGQNSAPWLSSTHEHLDLRKQGIATNQRGARPAIPGGVKSEFVSTPSQSRPGWKGLNGPQILDESERSPSDQIRASVQRHGKSCLVLPLLFPRHQVLHRGPGAPGVIEHAADRSGNRHLNAVLRGKLRHGPGCMDAFGDVP